MLNLYYDPLNSVIIQYSSSNSLFHYYNVIASTEIWTSLKDKIYALTDAEFRHLLSRGDLIKIDDSSVRDLFTYFTKCNWKEIDTKFKTIFKNFNKLKTMSTNYYFPKSKCFAFRDYWTHCFEYTVSEKEFIEILLKETANLVTEDFICSNLDLDYPEFVKNKFSLFRIKNLVEKYIDCYVLLYSKKRNSFSIYTVDKLLYITRVYEDASGTNNLSLPFDYDWNNPLAVLPIESKDIDSDLRFKNILETVTSISEIKNEDFKNRLLDIPVYNYDNILYGLCLLSIVKSNKLYLDSKSKKLLHS